MRALCQHVGITYDSTSVLNRTMENLFCHPVYWKYFPGHEVGSPMLNKVVGGGRVTKKLVLENPQISIGAVGRATDAMDATYQCIGISVSVPISDWWGTSHKVKEAKIKKLKHKTKLEEATELLALQVEQAKNEVNETYFQIGNCSKFNRTENKENLKVVNDNYKGGIVSNNVRFIGGSIIVSRCIKSTYWCSL